ncbi:hypothetical protein CRG98_008794 [Punica granatum]|uniref:Uncharacterized protein n=1 Tax=Punica granatum TaxID=22663 RepID=A0A2I0KQS4_PUNGR|nr:hypothetical protein CRG98_008794 [Punica granatum]
MDPRGLQYARVHCPVDCGVLERLLGWFARCRALARRVARCTAVLGRLKWGGCCYENSDSLEADVDAGAVASLLNTEFAVWPLCFSWRCPSAAMRDFVFAGCRVLKDSNSGVERLRIPSDRESESAVVLAICSTCDPGITSKSCEKY